MKRYALLILILLIIPFVAQAQTSSDLYVKKNYDPNKRLIEQAYYNKEWQLTEAEDKLPFVIQIPDDLGAETQRNRQKGKLFAQKRKKLTIKNQWICKR